MIVRSMKVGSCYRVFDWIQDPLSRLGLEACGRLWKTHMGL